MSARAVLAWVLPALLLVGALPAHAQTPLVEEVKTLSKGPQPVERTFEVTTAGAYRLTLTDLAVPVAMSSLRAAVTLGATVHGTLPAAGTLDLNLTAVGTYTMRVVGIPAAAGAGSFGVEIVNPASPATPVLAFADRFENPAPMVPSNRHVLDTTFDVVHAGNHEVTLIDRAFPAALSTLTLAILREGDGTLAAQLPAAGSATFAATTGRYRVAVIGEAAGSDAGVFAVRVRNPASQVVVFARTEPVGRVRLVRTLTLTAGSHELAVSDLAFPAPLQSAGALLVAGADEIARGAGPGAVLFTAAAGDTSLLIHAVPAAALPGNLGVSIRRDTGTVLSEVYTAAADPATAAPLTFSYPLDVATAGDYRLRITDFQFPQAFTFLGGAVVQNGAMLSSTSTAGTLNLTGVQTGRVFVLVLAQPGGASSGSGLFGIDFAPAGGTPLLERTEAVGALLSARTVSVANAGQYEVAVADLRFPAQFTELAVIVTRGPERLGSVYAGGSFPFAATPGNHIISVIAQPATASVYGTYSLRLAPRPAAPTITLAADQTTVANGGSAMLTWSTTGATACTATGGWTGVRATSGSERTSPLNSSTSFALACEGPGGQATASVSLAISAGASGSSSGGGNGGGGWLDVLTLLVTGGMLLWRLRARREILIALTAALSLAGLTRADSIAAPAPAREAPGYRIQPGDVLQIAVWKEEGLQGDILVRPDGGISFPLVGDLPAGGTTVVELGKEMKTRLARFIPEPIVTVTVKAIGGNRVYVLGKVNRPGEFAFSRPLDVMQALALAGGATPFAAVNDIRILRRTATGLDAVAFHYGEVERGRGLQQNILLNSGDTVVVP